MIRSFQGSPQIDPTAFIAETAVVIGDVRSAPEQPLVQRGGPRRCQLHPDRRPLQRQDLSMLHVTHRKGPTTRAPLVIGDDVTIGHSVTLHGCTIENGAFIGMQAIVMDKVNVGQARWWEPVSGHEGRSSRPHLWVGHRPSTSGT